MCRLRNGVYTNLGQRHIFVLGLKGNLPNKPLPRSLLNLHPQRKGRKNTRKTPSNREKQRTNTTRREKKTWGKEMKNRSAAAHIQPAADDGQRRVMCKGTDLEFGILRHRRETAQSVGSPRRGMAPSLRPGPPRLLPTIIPDGNNKRCGSTEAHPLALIALIPPISQEISLNHRPTASEKERHTRRDREIERELRENKRKYLRRDRPATVEAIKEDMLNNQKITTKRTQGIKRDRERERERRRAEEEEEEEEQQIMRLVLQ